MLCAGRVFLLKSKKCSREDCRVCRAPLPPESRAPAFRIQSTSLGVLLAPDVQPWPLQMEHPSRSPLTGAASLSHVSETFPHTCTCDLFSLAP